MRENPLAVLASCQGIFVCGGGFPPGIGSALRSAFVEIDAVAFDQPPSQRMIPSPTLAFVCN